MGSRSPLCDGVIEEIWQWAQERNVWILVSHIPGVENVKADAVSRIRHNDELEWALAPTRFQHAMEKLKWTPNIDLFASRLNYKVKPFYSMRPDQEAAGCDAFTIDWQEHRFYAFPPFPLIQRVLRKIGEEGATGVIVVPNWPTMVSITNEHDCFRTLFSAQIAEDAPTSADGRATSDGQEHADDGLRSFGQQFDDRGLTAKAKELLVQSWSGKTRGRYQSAMKKWEEYCINKGIASDVTAVENCVNFLASLRESGLGYSAINTARSAMSATVKLVEGGSVGSHPLITQIMKGIFKEAPTKPRYVNTWDPNVVLGFIDKEDVKKLDLRELSQRLAMLMLLCSGQRCQTLAQLAANVQFTNEGVIFEILGLLKTSRPGRVQNRLVFRRFKDNEKIGVVRYRI